MKPYYTLALIAIVLPLVAHAQEIGEPRLTVLENGLRVISVEDHKSPLVSAVWSAHVGDSIEPPELAGISHFVEHLVSGRGTEKYPGNAISTLVSRRGGDLDAQTWYDSTTFGIVLHSNELDEILDMHEQMMFRAVFGGKEFETEKKAVFEEIRADEDLPYEYLWDRAPYHMYPRETFYSRSTTGTIKKVQAVTVEGARQYYRDYYVPNNMTLVVVGDFDTEKLLAKIVSRFGKYERRKVPGLPYSALSIKPGVTVVTEEREVGKSYFLAAFEGPAITSPDYLPFELLMNYLGDGRHTAPLHETLVQKRKLFEKISASPLRRRMDKGWQPFSGEGESEKIAAGIDGLLEVLARVRAEGVPPEKLALTKNRVINAHRMANENGLKYATALAENDAQGDYRLVSDFEDRVGRVTPEDVWTVAKKYFGPKRVFLMALFPKGKIPAGFVNDVKRSASRHGQAPGGGVVSQPLESGATLLYEARPGSLVDSFTVAVKAGARDDGKRPGIANATATMMRRLTSRHSRVQLQEHLDREGITLAGNTTEDGTTFTLAAPSGKTETLAKLVREILSEPHFPENEWDAERRSLIADATSKLDHPREVAERELLAQLYPNTAYGARFEDYRKSLEGITPGGLIAFHRAFYRPERIAIAYVGRASRSSVAAALAGRLGAMRPSPKPNDETFKPIFPEGVQHTAVPMRRKQQVNLYWSWPGPSLDSDDWILWLLAQRAFGEDESSRLWQLRQKEGLAYEVWCDNFEFKDRPLAVVYMAFAKEKRPRAVSALEREVKKVLREGISAEELERVKVSFITSLERSDQTAMQRSDRIANWWVTGFSSDRRALLIRVASSATVGSVNRVIRQTLSAERFVKVEAGAVE